MLVRSNWFNRLLISYLPVFFMISLSLLFMTYYTLNEMSRESAIRTNQALTSNIAKLLDSNLASIDALLLYEIRNNARLRDFSPITRARSNSSLMFRRPPF